MSRIAMYFMSSDPDGTAGLPARYGGGRRHWHLPLRRLQAGCRFPPVQGNRVKKAVKYVGVSPFEGYGLLFFAGSGKLIGFPLSNAGTRDVPRSLLRRGSLRC